MGGWTQLLEKKVGDSGVRGPLNETAIRLLVPDIDTLRGGWVDGICRPNRQGGEPRLDPRGYRDDLPENRLQRRGEEVRRPRVWDIVCRHIWRCRVVYYIALITTISLVLQIVWGR